MDEQQLFGFIKEANNAHAMLAYNTCDHVKQVGLSADADGPACRCTGSRTVGRRAGHKRATTDMAVGTVGKNPTQPTLY